MWQKCPDLPEGWKPTPEDREKAWAISNKKAQAGRYKGKGRTGQPTRRTGMIARTRRRTGFATEPSRGTAMGPNGDTPVVGHGSWTAVHPTICRHMLVIFSFLLCLNSTVLGLLTILGFRCLGRGM